MNITPFCSNPVFSHFECTCQEPTQRTPVEGLLIVFLGIIQKVSVNIRLKTISEKENMSPGATFCG